MSGPGLGLGAQRAAPITARRSTPKPIIVRINADACVLKAAPNKAFAAAILAFFDGFNAR